MTGSLRERLTLSNACEVGLQLVVAVLDGPEVEGKAGKFIDFRDCRGIAFQVHDQEIALQVSQASRRMWGNSAAVKLAMLDSDDSSQPGQRVRGNGRRRRHNGADQFEGETIALRAQTSGLRRLAHTTGNPGLRADSPRRVAARRAQRNRSWKDLACPSQYSRSNRSA